MQDGNTPMELAMSAGAPGVVVALKAAGARY